MALETSKIRPKDRPSDLWCHVCQRYVAKTYHNPLGGRRRTFPDNVADSPCSFCFAIGSLSWTYEVEDKKWEPSCGNPDCQGECLNVSCIPPENQKMTDKERFLRIRMFSAGMVCTVLLECLLNLLQKLI